MFLSCSPENPILGIAAIAKRCRLGEKKKWGCVLLQTNAKEL
jgi:hypothetical protein